VDGSTEQALPRWLQAYAQPARAPQKPPPPHGALPVKRWSIPQELRNHRAWACWRYEYYAERWSKPPYNPETGTRAEPSDSSTWSDFDSCFEAYRAAAIPEDGATRPYDGVSFALDPRWGIVGIDLDHVAEHRLQANAIVDALGSYSEYSPGRDGYRIFCKGTLPEGRRRRGWVEMYSQRRFLTVTGQRLPNAPDHLTVPRRLYLVWDSYLNRG
jgi:primase-polymerase (primpol)-like protein